MMSMFARGRVLLLPKCLRRPVQSSLFCTTGRRCRDLESSRSVYYESKYAVKLQKRAQEQDKTVSQLRTEIQEQEMEKRKQSLAAASQKEKTPSASGVRASGSASSEKFSEQTPGFVARKDGSPVKPLNSILNLQRLFSAPHTTEQLSRLWQAYHNSRSGGTGRGFLSAVIPADKYRKMLDVATRYPRFVVPLPRDNAVTDSNERAYEFFLMEWGFYGSPPEPSTSSELFASPQPSANPQTSTVLFTPLQEYKLRSSFATPHLVLTHYTDLAQSHGLVLLRGEITPTSRSSAAGGGEADGRYLLSQEDAQILAVAVQRFYLWAEGENERTALLQRFHDSSENFKWEELLKHMEYSL
ncbi:hypothetical protein SCP_0113660 [Sparassis crispa]|uniref:ATP11-domain-containing protein n=1 Tax=Sparassis crispa TaxID=139825 RepID=A0A401G8J2_9APHY|nr:hypothetical protein SCP_0113660 [Sparassis crispa]GBE78477.1 hypothetical protein SCP_0113660 [Sparassis crispa]